ncbi:MAG: hypothetical protein D6759_06060 [Chloroflexi bacterium]|nr:MAG: hypothetical protein D6759_06060 [Chloroflexota bacterium]
MTEQTTQRKFGLVVHATHEAGIKLGGIGAVLEGLLSSGTYLTNVERTVLVGTMDTDDPIQMERLTSPRNRLQVTFSTYHGVDQVDRRLSARFTSLAAAYNVHLLYGRRAFGGTEHEVILVDGRRAELQRLNAFKRALYAHFGLESDRYEHYPEYSLYINAAEPAYMALKALVGGQVTGEKFIIAHEFMGLPLAFAAQIHDFGDYHTVFYAHEVATVRPLIENHPGHDTVFYNVMRAARRRGLYLEDVFGNQSGFFKHALIRRAIYCDNIFAVSDQIAEELRFLDPAFEEAPIDLVYNGIPGEEIGLEEKRASKALLQQYALNLDLFPKPPDYVFTHVTRLIPSKGLWRDIRVMEQLDSALARAGKRAVLFILATTVPAGRSPEEVRRMERTYGWPVVHREGQPDLIGHEIPLYHAIRAFNGRAHASRIVLVNQYGWSRDRCGERMPEAMQFQDLRRGTDLEFGQSTYEPFGIAQLEPLTYGALCVLSSVCGSLGFLRQAAGETLPPAIVVADYTALPPGFADKDCRTLLSLGRAERDVVEMTVARQVAAQIMERLPRDDEAVEALLAQGAALSQRMGWETVVRDYLLPGLSRAIR